jgi:lipoate-protein ligase A
MKELWKIWRSGHGRAAWNMAADEALLEMADQIGHPVLRFYGWISPAGTFGYSQQYGRVAEWTNLRPLIRRPTGGGFVPHENDWTYSLVFPSGNHWHGLKAEESYRRVHSWLHSSLEICNVRAQLSSQSQKNLPGQCFAGAERFDVLVDGRKLAGAAQRRNRSGLLVQGSIQPPPSQVRREQWEEAMLEEGARAHGNRWSAFEPAAAFIQRATDLEAAKYSRDSYNQKRF